MFLLLNLVTKLDDELKGNYDDPFKVFSLSKLLSEGLTLVLLIAAMVVFACLIWGGYQWLNSGDDAAKLDAAKARLTQCLIGFAILAVSYTLAILVSYFFGIDVLQPLPQTAWNPPPAGGDPPAPPGGGSGGTACDPSDPDVCGICGACIGRKCVADSGGLCSVSGCQGKCEGVRCVSLDPTACVIPPPLPSPTPAVCGPGVVCPCGGTCGASGVCGNYCPNTGGMKCIGNVCQLPAVTIPPGAATATPTPGGPTSTPPTSDPDLDTELVYLPMIFKQAAAATQGGGSGSALAQSWTSSIEYFNAGNTQAVVTVKFYAKDSGSVQGESVITVPAHGAGSLSVGSVPGIPSGFLGSAVVSSTQPVAAAAVQSAGTNYPNPTYAGFRNTQAGMTAYISTVLRSFAGSTSLVAIQNIGQNPVTAQTKFYELNSGGLASTITSNIPAQSVVFIPAQDAGLTNTFTGSAVVTANGSVAAVSQEMATSDREASAFESLKSGGSTINMATALCNFGTLNQNSYYAIQNVGSQPTNARIAFYNVGGSPVGSSGNLAIGAGSKFSLNVCNEGLGNGAFGSAVITSNSSPVIAIGKVSSPTTTSAAANAEASGSKLLVAPYTRWAASTSSYRTFFAVMNVGSGDARDIKATYYDANGQPKVFTLASASNPLKPRVKRNTNPGDVMGGASLGYSPAGGALEIRSDQQVIMTVRTSKDLSLGAYRRFVEDYNGIHF